MAEKQTERRSTGTDASSVSFEKPSHTTEKTKDEGKNSNWISSIRSFFTLPKIPTWERESRLPVTALFSDLNYCPKVLFIGLHDAGKSALLLEYLSASEGKDIEKLSPTIGIHFEMLHHRSASFQCTDIGGCRPGFFKMVERAAFGQADAVIYVVDAANEYELDDSREQLMYEGLLDVDGMRKDTPLLILANKQDKPGARDAKRIKAYFVDNISTSIGDRPCHVVGTSVTTGEGLEEGFRWLGSVLAEFKKNQIDEKARRKSTRIFDRSPAIYEVGEIMTTANNNIKKRIAQQAKNEKAQASGRKSES